MVYIDYQFDKSGSRPLYIQMAEHLTRRIASGEFAVDERMPTETALAEETGLSKGTIKAAYAHLQRQGIVRKRRGSGTYANDSTGAPKEPERIIAALFDNLLHEMGMSVSEAHLLFQRQLDEVFAEDNLVNVTLVDCNLETIHVIKKQLQQVPGTIVSHVIHDDLLFTGHATLPPDCELVLTTQLHYLGVCRYTEPRHILTEPFSLRETNETLAMLSKLPDNAQVCIVYRSDAFLSSARYTLRMTNGHTHIIACHEDDLEKMSRYSLSGLPFLLPPDYMEYSSSHALQCIYRARAAGSRIIPIQFEIDRGSILNISEIVARIRAEKGRR